MGCLLHTFQLWPMGVDQGAGPIQQVLGCCIRRGLDAKVAWSLGQSGQDVGLAAGVLGQADSPSHSRSVEGSGLLGLVYWDLGPL